MAWTGNPINVKREILIGFDLLLAVVVGLVLYAASARDRPARRFLRRPAAAARGQRTEWIDGVALAAIAARISEFGFTPNRVAALGENLILLVNLAWSAWLYASFLRQRGSFAAWSDGRSPICPCTPYGRRWWLSCSRPCSATVDAPHGHCTGGEAWREAERLERRGGLAKSRVAAVQTPASFRAPGHLGPRETIRDRGLASPVSSSVPSVLCMTRRWLVHM